jgi:anti-sigma regulatory factor (Ser/Thr protein kinase)
MSLVPASATTLPARPTSVGVARRFLVQLLEAWDLQGLEYDASVVLSELVTNAVLHARTEVRLEVSYEDSVLRLEVSDGSPKLPMAKRPNPQAATGKGLVLIDALATEWGVRPEPNGKTIWASFVEAGALETSTPTIRLLRPPRGRHAAGGGRSPGDFPSQARAAS